MFSLVNLPAIAEMAVIEGVREHLRNRIALQNMTAPGNDSLRTEECANSVKRGSAARIHIEGLFHNWREFTIENDLLRPVIIQISERRLSWELTPANLFPKAALCVL